MIACCYCLAPEHSCYRRWLIKGLLMLITITPYHLGYKSCIHFCGLSSNELYVSTYFPLWSIHFFHQCSSAQIPLAMKLLSCWSKNSHQQLIWHYHHCGTASQPNTFYVREQMTVRWSHIKRKGRLINHFKTIVMQSSHWKQQCVLKHCPNETRPASSFSEYLVLITFHDCLRKLV